MLHRGGDPDAVPTDADDLFAWLQARNYETFAAESSIHPSTGPHGAVRTFVNAPLASSMAAGNASHPIGAAAIKELHSGGSLTGWAVEVKVSEAAGDGTDWYWYEVFSTTDGSDPFVDGTGVSLCANCHSGGTDYVLTPWPLQ